jgi:hypothetical protein
MLYAPERDPQQVDTTHSLKTLPAKQRRFRPQCYIPQNPHLRRRRCLACAGAVAVTVAVGVVVEKSEAGTGVTTTTLISVVVDVPGVEFVSGAEDTALGVGGAAVGGVVAGVVVVGSAGVGVVVVVGAAGVGVVVAAGGGGGVELDTTSSAGATDAAVGASWAYSLNGMVSACGDA